MSTPRTLLILVPLLLAAVLALAEPRSGATSAPDGDLRKAIHADAWLNTAPLGAEDLEGKAVLVEFWTFACWNCKNVEPYVKRWHDRYADDGLVVIAVHTPEFDFERKVENVRDYAKKRGVDWPIVVDNTFKTWKAFDNYAWPTFYLLDGDGRVRHKKVGEGGYAATEAKIQALLAELDAQKAKAAGATAPTAR